MRERSGNGSRRGRDLLLAVCGVCTVWLLVQNALLLALMPWERLPGALHSLGLLLRGLVVMAVPLTLVTATVLVAWWRTRDDRAAAHAGGSRD